MSTVSRWRRRLRVLLRKSEVEREMEEEMRFHLEMEIEDLIRGGMSPGEARRVALRDFGGVDRFKEEVRDVQGFRWLGDLGQDARAAVRVLLRDPAFTVVAVLTLALGIGANTAVFSVVQATLLRPPPYPDADEIVVLRELGDDAQEMSVTGPNFLDWRAMNRTLDGAALHWNPDYVPLLTVVGASSPVRTRTTGVTREFFRVMGVQPVRGRAFTPEEAREGGAAAVVVSHSFWANHLGGEASALGRVLDFDGAPHQVVGVMPPGFGYPADTDLWVALERGGISGGRRAHNYSAVARLRDGVSREEAQRELTRITAALKEQHRGDMDAVGVGVERLQDALVGDLRRPLLMLFGAAVLLLLVACTNLASTFLARGAGREREVAVRVSLGASRARLVRQFLTESLVLSLLGAMVGIGLAVGMLRLLLALGPASLSMAGAAGLNGWVLGFALLVALASAVLFGLFPALRTSEGKLGGTLRTGSRGNAQGHRGRAWGVLVGGEVALAIVLLIGSGLLVKSFRQVLGVEMGFDPRQVLTVDLALPDSKYGEDPQIASFYGRALDELRALPGVEHAGLIQHLPLGGLSHNGSFEVEGRGESGAYADYRVASGGYFPAMGIPLRRGRLFAPADGPATGDVAVINEALAERVWPGEDPVGKRIRNLANDSWKYPDRWITIVGVVGNVRPHELTGATPPEIYVHYLQRPNRARSAVLTLRTSVPPASIIPGARARIRALDSDVPAEFATMSARVVESVADRRFTTLVLGTFAGVALVLAAIGIYGVVSYAVARRTREIGIRLALGAEPSRVRSMVQGSAMRVVLAGVAVGVGGAVLLTRSLQGLLYEVSPTDPSTFGGVVLALTGVAWLASYLPARRTTLVDPMISMRNE